MQIGDHVLYLTLTGSYVINGGDDETGSRRL